MIDEKKMDNAKRALKRIFALPINRSTYREMHSAFHNIFEGNTELANNLLEILLTGDVNSEKAKNFPKKQVQSLIDEFSVLVWTAKDVFEKGDFISLVTSDMISTPNQQVFSNRMKRIDGEEFHFITDVESTLQLLTHFAARIHELEKNPAAKQFLNSRRNELTAVKKKLETLLVSST
jgi:Family of unknown function (DUF5414)